MENYSDDGIMEKWLDEKYPFVFFRYPGNKTVKGFRQHYSPVHSYNDILHIDGKCGFVFVPFQCGKEHSLWLIEPDETTEFELKTIDNIPQAPQAVEWCGKKPQEPDYSYKKSFYAFSKSLNEGIFQKLVLSRKESMNAPEGFSAIKAFITACNRYVNSYVYMLFLPETGIWIGATPELLLSGNGNEYSTVALAGTQALSNGNLISEWNGKNIEEQKFVSDYIIKTLNDRNILASSIGPYTVTAGALAHLKTEIKFKFNGNKSIGSLLDALHPTPAVCGLPKKEAYDFVQENEDYDRGYYSGFLGYINTEAETSLFVNLRCMHYENNIIDLFAGGGILPQSELEEEWKETEKKMQTMKYVIFKSSE